MFRRATARALTVGPVLGGCPAMDRDPRALMRVSLPDGASADSLVRQALDTHPAIEVVEDPTGISHEAVPYEALIYAGPTHVADSLGQTLPRFFAPLSYRRLDFGLRHVPLRTGGVASALFGDLVDPHLGAPRGSILVGPDVTTAQTAPHWPDGPGGAPMHWHGGQRHGVFALGDGPAADGLARTPWPGAGGDGQAVVIRPGSTAPVAELRPLLPPQPDATGPIPVLGGATAQIDLTAHGDYEIFDGSFGPAGPAVVVAPDSAFSRFLSAPRAGLDLLEILGVFVPAPGPRGPVAATSVRLDAARRLMAHGLRSEANRIVMLSPQEALVQPRHGTAQQVGRGGRAGELGLRLTRAQAVDPSAPRGWWALTAEAEAPLGWLPLRVGPGSDEDSLRVPQSALCYGRTRWIDRRDTGPDAASLFVDWLDDAVQLVVRDPSGGGTHHEGLARYISGLPPSLQRHLSGAIRHDSGGLELAHSSGGQERLRCGQSFRLGALWVRLRTARGRI